MVVSFSWQIDCVCTREIQYKRGQTLSTLSVRAERATDPEGHLGAYTATPGLPLPQHTEGWARAEHA